MEEFWIFVSQKLPKTRNPSGTAHPAQPHGATVKFISLVSLLALALTGCGDAPEIRKPTTLQACVRPAGVTPTAFEADGAMKWTAEMADGAVGVRYCDGDLYRTIEVVGLQRGLAANRQAEWAVDAHNQVITIDDLEGAISPIPVPTHRLVGVTIQCVSLPGSSCEPGESPPGT